MHKEYGKIKRSELYKSAITIAENGFVIETGTANLIQNAFLDFSEYAKSFYSKNGAPLQKGDTLIQKDLAQTFSIIAQQGATPFYHGVIGESIDKQL